jgi:uncharacterized protein (TIGR02145 family)
MKQVIASVLVALPILLSAQQACEPTADLNQDGVVGISDLLNLLSAFGDTDLDFDGIYDSVDECTDTTACNYDANPTSPCNFFDVIGECGGDCILDSNEDGECDDFLGPCDGVFYNFDGYDYEIIEIGDQCWFAENLRSIHYANGDVIPGQLGEYEWWSTESGAQAIYGEGTSGVASGNENAEENLLNYGRLYNGHSVIDERGICPNGWNVPSDSAFMALEIFLGMDETEANSSQGQRGTFEGDDIKASPEDSPSWNGLNTVGFAALPGGKRHSPGYWQEDYAQFGGEGQHGVFWTSTVNPWSSWEPLWVRDLWEGYSTIQKSSELKNTGISVRCLKD